jgi:N-acetylmuramoyl-L-alanine amidase
MSKKLILFFLSAIILIAGCASVPRREELPAFNINGTTYLPLVTLCDLKNITWQYDTFSRTAVLNKDSHRINLMVGDTLVLVDGIPQYLKHPVELYQGTIAVPYRFKEQIIDSLFKEYYPQRKAALPFSAKIRKIVIDAGHGGNDPGAIGRTGLREKDVNLDIAKRLSTLLRSDGIQVVMTRSSDRFIPLSTRVAIANNSRADLFISIHSNANRVRSLNGFEVYYVAGSVSDAKRAYASANNAVLNLDNAYFSGRSLELKAIVWDLIYTNSRAESIELARSLCQAMNSNLEARILGVKGARFEVLRGARMPAVLIETGFLSNYNEERMLKNSYYRQRIAQSLEQGVREYSYDTALMEVARR